SAAPLGSRPGLPLLAWPDGERSTAKAAEAAQPSATWPALTHLLRGRDRGRRPAVFRWFQLYVYRDRKLSERWCNRVEALGFKALVLTVDVPYTGKRRSDIRNNFQPPAAPQVKNFEGVFE
ncbi:hypothetical protein FKM82_027448, partial [Ascaphus truei]